MNQETKSPVPDTLTGLPGLGPVRRRLLTEAGITTREALAAATVDQIISVTGMPRAAAEQVHVAAQVAVVEIAEAPAIAEPLPDPQTNPASTTPTDEAPPEPVDDIEPPAVVQPEATRLERAILRVRTAIADASRHASPKSKLAALLVRFARLADVLPNRLPTNARPNVIRRVAERLEEIAARLEAFLAKAPGKPKVAPLSSKRAKRLRQRLKRTRDSIKRTLKVSAAKVTPDEAKESVK